MIQGPGFFWSSDSKTSTGGKKQGEKKRNKVDAHVPGNVLRSQHSSTKPQAQKPRMVEKSHYKTITMVDSDYKIVTTRAIT